MTAKLWIPGADKGEPAFKCLTCGDEFAEGDKRGYVNHTVRCSKSVEDDMAEFIAHRESNAFTGNPDTEVAEWKRKRRAEGKPVTNGRGSLA